MGQGENVVAHLKTDKIEMSNKNYIGIDLLHLAMASRILKLKLDGHFDPFGSENSFGSPRIDCWL